MKFDSGRPTTFKSYFLNTPAGSSGTFYAAGYYNAPAADANLTQAGATQTLGEANVPYAAHVFVVAGDAGTATGGTGAVTITVTGTTINDAGTRAESQTVTLVSDITTMATDGYYETTEKWIGQVTITLEVGATGHTAYAADFNYGFAKYEDFGNRSFTVKDFEVVGLAGATDGAFNCQLIHHKSTGWTYDATAFVPGTGAITGTDFATVNSTESDLDASLPFAFKRANLSTVVDGTGLEGLIIKVVTGQNNAVEFLDAHIGVNI